MEQDLMTIDLNRVKELAKSGDKFIFKPEAEESLKELLYLQQMINAVVEDVKNAIADAGKQIDPNFKGVIGADIRCIYRKYGAKYKYDLGRKAVAMPFLKEKQYFSVDADKVDAYLQEVGELPDGILEAERDDTLSFYLKGDKDD